MVLSGVPGYKFDRIELFHEQISGWKSGYMIGYKYFDFKQDTELYLTVKGKASGTILIQTVKNDKTAIEK